MGIALAINISGAQAAGGSTIGITTYPSVSGTRKVGQTLTRTVGTYTGSGTVNVTGGRWQRNGVDISGATGATYVQVAADYGQVVNWREEVSDDESSRSVADQGSTPTTDVAPVNTVIPTISGGTTLGSVLTLTDPGTWTGFGISYTNQWTRDDVAIPGETGTTYTTTTADSAAKMNCVVTATNLDGSTAETSNSITMESVPVAPVITGVPTISGAEQVGQTLTATPAPVTGNPTPTRTWQWVNSASGDISGATSSTYVLQPSDEGDRISVRQTETNSEGSDIATSAQTGVIAGVPETNYIKNFTQGNATNQTYDLDAIVPAPVGSTSYAWETSAPTGVSLASNIVTVNTNTASAAVDIRIIRTDDNGARLLIGDLQYTTFNAVIGTGVLNLNYGPDDIASTQYSGTFSGGAYDGVSWSVTKGEMDALANGQGEPVVDVSPPVFVSGGPELAPGDEIDPGRAGLWAYPTGNTPPTITTSLFDEILTVLVANFTSTYTADGSEILNVFTSENDGAKTQESTKIPVESSGPTYRTLETFTVGSTVALIGYTGDAGIAWVDQNSSVSGNPGLVDAGIDRVRANGTGQWKVISQGSTSWGDQSSRCTLTRQSGGDWIGVTPAVRIGSNSGYFIRCDHGAGQFRLMEMTGGTASYTGITGAYPSGLFDVGDTLAVEIRAIGTTISFWYSTDGWSSENQIFSGTDSSHSAGFVGVGCYGNSTGAVQLDNFEGGDWS